MKCDIKSCIYVIRCAGCSEYCISETVDVRQSTNLHRHYIRRNTGLNISKRVHECTENANIVHNFNYYYK